MNPKEAFRPASPHFGSMVSPVAEVVTEPRPDPLAIALAALREIEASGHQSQYWLVRLAKEALRKIDRNGKP
jgi:hypothetical protein